MALPISNIPILTGVAAASFVKNAKAVEENRGSVDFSRQCAELLTRTTKTGCRYLVVDATTKLHTRMMYFDLMLLTGVAG